MRSNLLDDDLTGEHQNWDPRTITKINDAKIEINDHLKKIKQGRLVLFALAGFSLLGIVSARYYITSSGVIQEDVLIEGIVLIVIYLGAALYFPRNPLVSLAVGLSVFGLVHILSAIVEPASLYQGIVIKSIFLYGLLRGVFSAQTIRRQVTALQHYGVPRRETEEALRKLKPLRKTPRRINVERD